MTTQRKYKAIWDRIKEAGTGSTVKPVRIRVIPGLAPRVRKAVIKEKGKDLAFKVMNDHDNFWLQIEYDSNAQIMSFRLKQTLGLEGMKKV